MPDRRTFLITCGTVAVTPTLAHFALPSPNEGPPVSLAPAVSTLTLKIEGWQPRTDSGSDVWVQVNASWRATWR